MLTGRSVIIVVVLVAVVSIVASTVSLLGPQDHDGLGADSYGTQPHGYRAILDILAELEITSDRTVIPPTESLDRPITLVLWAPQTDLVSSEPSYLQRIGQWMRRGGRVVVACESRKASKRRRQDASDSPIKETSAVEQFGLTPIRTRVVNLDNLDDSASPKRRATRQPTTDADLTPSKIAGRVLDALVPALGPTRSVSITSDGDLAPLAMDVAALQVPDELQVLDVGTTEPSGRILVPIGAKEPLVIAALYRLDEGELIVVSEPHLLENRLIATDDNAVLAVRLLTDTNRTVMWDEFYHGLTIRGQPLFLLTRGTYALFALLSIATTAIWVWRSALFLGPPLAAVQSTRRTLAEYVNAMAKFLNHGPGSRRFVLGEVRAGILWAIRKKLGLAPSEQSPATLAAAIARHDPRAARRLLDAVATADLTLSQPSRITDRRALGALKGLNDCL